MAVSDPNQHIEIDATQARQGRWGQHMFWVLLAGVLLAFAALLGAWAYRANDLAQVDSSARVVAEQSPEVSNVTPTVEPGPGGG